MKVTHVMIELEKMVSDGNYGRERAVVQFSADIDDELDEDGATRELLDRARDTLNAQLSRSESLNDDEPNPF